MNIKKRLLRSVYLLALICLFNSISVRESCSAVYRYINHEGFECYTNNRSSIPAEFRGKAVKIDRYEERQGSPEFSKTTEKNTAIAADEEEETPEITDMDSQLSWRISESKLYKSVIAFVVVVIAFIAAGKIGDAVGGRHVSTILRIVLTVGLLLFLYNLHSKEMVDAYNGIKEMTNSVKDVKENRDRKMTDAVNELFPEPKKGE